MTDRPGADLEMARERELRDVERTMISIVQLSLSMIGFGFTIHAFLSNAGAERMMSIDLNAVARRIGLALLCLGLLNLIWGVWNQMAQMRVIGRRYPTLSHRWRLGAYSAAPTFFIASLLLVGGLGALVSMAAKVFR